MGSGSTGGILRGATPYNTLSSQANPMTAAPWNPKTLTMVTLPEGTWGTIRTALLCIACDESTKGNPDDAAHWLAAYNDLKEALGM
jgi:hypothetical protein